MKKILLVFVLTIILSLPVSVKAVSTADLFIQIQSLLKIVQQLQVQLAEINDIQRQPVLQASAARPAFCQSLSTTRFGIGLRSGNVIKLQQFLKSTGDFTYPEFTTYYGQVTAKAVQKYQCRILGVCSGSPSSTGYGLAGPGTRREMCREKKLPQPNPFDSIPAQEESVNNPSVTVSVSCIPLLKQKRNITCPAGQTGSIRQVRDSICLDGSINPAWKDWETVSVSCDAQVTDPVIESKPSIDLTNIGAISFSTGVIDANDLQGSQSYAYAPHFMYDEGKYKVWACGNYDGLGDSIVFKEAATIGRLSETPWSQAFTRSTASDFDNVHTCDPSVLRVGNVWYLYYTGAQAEEIGYVGLAKSNDGGRTFYRINNEPIVSPRVNASPGSYGAGQQSIIYHKVDRKYYMIYTDSYLDIQEIKLIRSSSPLFPSSDRELVKTYGQSDFAGVSLGLVYDDLNAKLIVISNASSGTTTSDTIEWFKNLAGVGLHHLDSNFNIQKQVMYKNPNAKFRFGEGIGILQNSSGEIHLSKDAPSATITAIAATWKEEGCGLWACWVNGPMRYMKMFLGGDTSSSVIGYIDDAIEETEDDYLVKGWACDYGLDAQIDVHAYIGGIAGIGVLVAKSTANLFSEDPVNTACSSFGAGHRFEIKINKLNVAHFNDRVIYIHGIASNGNPYSNYPLEVSGIKELPVFKVESNDINTLHELVYNPAAYKKYNPDLQSYTDTQLKEHWLTHGISRGLRAHENFCSKDYLNRYLDLGNSFGSDNYQQAILHYLEYGLIEKRDGRCG